LRALAVPGQRVHQGEAFGFLCLEHAVPAYWPDTAITGSDPRIAGQNNLVAQDEAVDDQMVAVDLPAQGCSGDALRRR